MYTGTAQVDYISCVSVYLHIVLDYLLRSTSHRRLHRTGSSSYIEIEVHIHSYPERLLFIFYYLFVF